MDRVSFSFGRVPAMLDNPAIIQNILACVFLSYIAFCILYAHASLKSRRAAAAAATGPSTTTTPTFKGTLRQAGLISRLCIAMVLPVLGVAAIFTLAGREHTGIVEPGRLFTVPVRHDANISYLTRHDTVERGEVIARFSSDELDHLIDGLRARRREATAARDAIKASALPVSGEFLVKQQAADQRIAQFDQRLKEIDRSKFSIRHQLLSMEASWRQTREALLSRLPELQQSLTAAKVAHDTATQALQRVERLHQRGYATLPQLERVTVDEAVGRQRLEGAQTALVTTRSSLVTLDEGHQRNHQLLSKELEKLTSEAEENRKLRRTAQDQRTELVDRLAVQGAALAAQREH